MDQASETFLYPRFDTLTGDMCIFPQWPPTPTGPGYISLAQLAAFVATAIPFLTITGSTALPTGAIGTVLVRNMTAAAITVTLPPTPAIGQTILFKDATGNAGTYPITIQAGFVVLTSSAGWVLTDSLGNVLLGPTGGGTVDGNASYVLQSDYASVELFWMGDQWGTR